MVLNKQHEEARLIKMSRTLFFIVTSGTEATPSREESMPPTIKSLLIVTSGSLAVMRE